MRKAGFCFGRLRRVGADLRSQDTSHRRPNPIGRASVRHRDCTEVTYYSSVHELGSHSSKPASPFLHPSFPSQRCSTTSAPSAAPSVSCYKQAALTSQPLPPTLHSTPPTVTRACCSIQPRSKHDALLQSGMILSLPVTTMQSRRHSPSTPMAPATCVPPLDSSPRASRHANHASNMLTLVFHAGLPPPGA